MKQATFSFIDTKLVEYIIPNIAVLGLCYYGICNSDDVFLVTQLRPTFATTFLLIIFMTCVGCLRAFKENQHNWSNALSKTAVIFMLCLSVKNCIAVKKVVLKHC